ncbi:FUSC family protein [Corynebacterium sp. A21]|uniref:FUSC family protein n=1 Tax=Corynebacterium sp. A21 TaxID=3457318 RepID=UPI003FD20961
MSPADNIEKPAPGQRLRAVVDERMSRPEFQTSLIQVAKTIFATTLAWWISITFLDTSFPFLAPWTALLTIQATAYRTLSRGVQSTIASVLGIVVTFLVGQYLGVSLWTYALALLIGLFIAHIRWIREEGITVATTAIFLLSDGFTEQSRDFGERMLEILVGVSIGVLVNMLVLPPLRDRQASNYINSVTRRMGVVLENMGTEIASSWDTECAEEWIKEIESLDSELSSAWSAVRFARESRRINPRRRIPLRRNSRIPDPADGPSWEEVLEQIKEGLSYLRAITHILHDATYADGSWDTRFRAQWSAIARDAGQTIADPDTTTDSDRLRERLDDLAHEMSRDEDLPRKLWPIYGSLLTGLRHIVSLVDEVHAVRRAEAR